MPGRKSSSGSERKPSGSKPDPKASSSKPDPKTGSQPKGSPDKKDKHPIPKSTQDEPSKENRHSRAGEPSARTQLAAGGGNITQAMPGQSPMEMFREQTSQEGPYFPGSRQDEPIREEEFSVGRVSPYPQDLGKEKLGKEKLGNENFAGEKGPENDGKP
ncbi:hypothetical protein ACHAPA_000861 [Fusarium lateritium]